LPWQQRFRARKKSRNELEENKMRKNRTAMGLLFALAVFALLISGAAKARASDSGTDRIDSSTSGSADVQHEAAQTQSASDSKDPQHSTADSVQASASGDSQHVETETKTGDGGNAGSSETGTSDTLEQTGHDSANEGTHSEGTNWDFSEDFNGNGTAEIKDASRSNSGNASHIEDSGMDATGDSSASGTETENHGSASSAVGDSSVQVEGQAVASAGIEHSSGNDASGSSQMEAINSSSDASSVDQAALAAQQDHAISGSAPFWIKFLEWLGLVRA
jgi:hypothetical protein